MVKPGEGDQWLKVNGAGENLAWSPADFENFSEPRPQLQDKASDELEAADFDRVLAVNLRGPFLCSREALRHFLPRGKGGVILSTSSVHEIIPKPKYLSYSISKSGIEGLTRTLALEYAGRGIRVNAVAPGAVGSGNEDQPEGQWAVDGINPLAAPRAHDIANGVLFLSSELAARITGQTLVVDGGATTRELWGFSEDILPQFRTGSYG